MEFKKEEISLEEVLDLEELNEIMKKQMNKAKYRAWLKDEKRMVKVLSIDFQNKEIGFAPIETDLNDFSKIDDYYAVLETKRFDKIELMQFINQDIDEDKEVYEGDIIKFVVSIDYQLLFLKGVVKWTGSRFMIWHDNENDCFNGYYHGFNLDWVMAEDNIEVIGNIYENPELLEEQEEEENV